MSLGRSWKSLKAAISKPFSNWWEGQRANHLPILGMLTFLSVALLIWSIVFFTTFAPNAQQEANEWTKFVPATWAGVLLSVILIIFVVPEFFHYYGIYSNLVELLESTSKADLKRNEKELKEGSELLGGLWPGRVAAKQVELGLRREIPKELALPDSEGAEWLKTWMKTKESRLSKRFSNQDLLKDPGINRIFIGASLIGLIGFTYNAIFGVARETVDSPRNMSIDLTSIVSGGPYNATWSPNLDLVSGLLMVLLAVILYLTMPASTESSESISDEEE